ncbi:hypothetical protein ACE0DR_26160 [Azotobacter sp. CWF10]
MTVTRLPAPSTRPAVRGAPAIGIAAAWGVVLAAREVQAADGAHALRSWNRHCSA